jgi:hypothetical protein
MLGGLFRRHRGGARRDRAVPGPFLQVVPRHGLARRDGEGRGRPLLPGEHRQHRQAGARGHRGPRALQGLGHGHDPPARRRPARLDGLPRLRRHRGACARGVRRRSPRPACANRTCTTCRSPRKRPTTTSTERAPSRHPERLRGRRFLFRRSRFPPHGPQDPHPRFRLPGHPAHRAPRARAAGVLRAASPRRPTSSSAQLRRAGRHPLRRAQLGLRGEDPRASAGGVRAWRAGARHLLRHADDGQPARRQGESSAKREFGYAEMRARGHSKLLAGIQDRAMPRATACSTCG